MDFTDFESHHKVIDSIEISDRVIYLFDYMDFPRHAQAQNLKCFTKEGKLVWIAEHPTNSTNDSYTSISFDKVLKAFSFGCYSVEIDIDTGKILRKVFTK